MATTSVFVHANVVDIECFSVLQQYIVLYFSDLTKSVTQHATVVVHEYRIIAIAKHSAEFLFFIFSSVWFEQVGTNFVMHHVNLMQQIDNHFNIVVTRFTYHILTIV